MGWRCPTAAMSSSGSGRDDLVEPDERFVELQQARWSSSCRYLQSTPYYHERASPPQLEAASDRVARTVAPAMSAG